MKKILCLFLFIILVIPVSFGISKIKWYYSNKNEYKETENKTENTQLPYVTKKMRWYGYEISNRTNSTTINLTSTDLTSNDLTIQSLNSSDFQLRVSNWNDLVEHLKDRYVKPRWESKKEKKRIVDVDVNTTITTAAWTAPETISESVFHPKIELDSFGILHAAWIEPVTKAVYTQAVNDNWESPYVLYDLWNESENEMFFPFNIELLLQNNSPVVGVFGLDMTFSNITNNSAVVDQYDKIKLRNYNSGWENWTDVFSLHKSTCEIKYTGSGFEGNCTTLSNRSIEEFKIAQSGYERYALIRIATLNSSSDEVAQEILIGKSNIDQNQWEWKSIVNVQHPNARQLSLGCNESECMAAWVENTVLKTATKSSGWRPTSSYVTGQMITWDYDENENWVPVRRDCYLRISSPNVVKVNKLHVAAIGYCENEWGEKFYQLVIDNTSFVLDEFFNPESQILDLRAKPSSTSERLYLGFSTYPNGIWLAEFFPNDNWSLVSISKSPIRWAYSYDIASNGVQHLLISKTVGMYTRTKNKLKLTASAVYNGSLLSVEVFAYNIDLGIPLNDSDNRTASFVLYREGGQKMGKWPLNFSNGVWKGSKTLLLEPGKYIITIDIAGSPAVLAFTVVKEKVDLEIEFFNDKGMPILEPLNFTIYAQADAEFNLTPVASVVSTPKQTPSGTTQSVTVKDLKPDKYTAISVPTKTTTNYTKAETSIRLNGTQSSTKTNITVPAKPSTTQGIPTSKGQSYAQLHDLVKNLNSTAFKAIEIKSSALADISSRYKKDMDSSPAKDVLGFIIALLKKDPAALVVKVIEYASLKTYEKTLTTLVNATINYNISGIPDSAKRNTILKILEGPQTAQALATSELANAVKTKLNAATIAFVSNKSAIHDDFSLARARELIKTQEVALSSVGVGYTGRIALADPSVTAVLSFNFASQEYLGTVARLQSTNAQKTLSGIIAIGASVLGIITAPVGGLAVFGSIAVSAFAGTAALGLNVIEITLEQLVAQNYYITAVSWANDLSLLPTILSNTTTLLLTEGQNPKWLNAKANYDVDVSMSIVPDAIKNNKKIIFLDPKEMTKTRTFNLTISNKGNSTIVRAIADVTWLYDYDNSCYLFFKCGDIDYISILSSSDAWSAPLNKNEKITGTLSYVVQYRDPKNIFNPHFLTVRIFSGPFHVATKGEWIYALQTSQLSEFKKGRVNNPTIRATIAEGGLDLDEWNALAPDPELLASGTLNGLNRTFTLDVYAGSEAELQFYLIGPPEVDLHVYKDGKHVGYNAAQDDVVTEFPARYSDQNSIPEIITIPSPVGKYRVGVELREAESTMSRDFSLYVLRVPRRPAVLSTLPSEINRELQLDENLTFSVFVAEAGGQQPIENVSASLQLDQPTGIGVSSTKQNVPLIPAGEDRRLTWTISALRTGNWSGKIIINSSAGQQIIPLNISVRSDLPRLSIKNAKIYNKGSYVRFEIFNNGTRADSINWKIFNSNNAVLSSSRSPLSLDPGQSIVVYARVGSNDKKIKIFVNTTEEINTADNLLEINLQN